MLVHLVNKLTADMRRALWWQERTAKHRYMLRLAAGKQQERMQEELAQKRYSFFLPQISWIRKLTSYRIEWWHH